MITISKLIKIMISAYLFHIKYAEFFFPLFYCLFEILSIFIVLKKVVFFLDKDKLYIPYRERFLRFSLIFNIKKYFLPVFNAMCVIGSRVRV